MLGKGNVGTVFSATWQAKKVAFKKFNFQRNSEKWKKVLELEVRSLCSLSHPNIVGIYGAVLDNGSIGIVMEHLPHSLYQVMFVEGKRLSEEDKRALIRHVSEGLSYLHSMNIVHCNLTSRNVLVSANNSAKISNYEPKFVRSKFGSTSSFNIGEEIDCRYASPEILHIRPLNIEQLAKCDIYSLGILVCEVFETKEPCKDLPSDILQNKSSAHWIKHMSPSILDMVMECLAVNSETRPTAEGFLEEWKRLNCKSIASL